MTPKYWIRLSIDLDPALNPIGSSYEVHDADGRPVTLVVPPVNGPFDSVGDVLRDLLDDVVSRYGVPLSLF